MSAYSALNSLENTLGRILGASLVSSYTKSIIRSTHCEVQSWKKILKRLDESSKSKTRKKVNALDGRIKQIVWNFEDLVETLFSHQISLQSDENENEDEDEDEDEGDEDNESEDEDGDEDEDEGEGDGDVDEDLVETLFSHQLSLQSNEDEGDEDEDDESEGGDADDDEGEGKGDEDDESEDGDDDDDECEGDGDEDDESEDEDGDEDEDEEEDEDEGEEDVPLFSIDITSLLEGVNSFMETLNNMAEEYNYEVDNMPEDEDEDESRISSSLASATADTDDETKLKMIGFSDQFEEIKQQLHAHWDKRDYNFVAYGLVGMAGLGKTTLARQIYKDPEVTSRFDFRLWITLGRKASPRLNQDVLSILGELDGRERCLIVLDDAWETQELSSLLISFGEMKNSRIRILITTRQANVMKYAEKNIYWISHVVVRFLNEEESKELLCHNVFGENIICPPQLVKAATKIARKCEGLPLTIVTVADLISRSQNNDLDYWEDVAEERNTVFNDAYAEITKVLFPTYDYLPQRLKMPFLYLGVFPRDYDIPRSKLKTMLAAEGWFHDRDNRFVDCLESLCDSFNLVLCKQRSIYWFEDPTGVSFKTCRLHSSWRYLCRREAQNNKFYHVLNRLDDASEETIKGQRCLCLENNLLFGLTEFSNSVRLNSAVSYTRSLLFFGPYHQYPTPIDAIGFKLLRELDALQLRFYVFPTEILKLIQLKYLALTCNGQLPPTISKLFNLQTFIIHPHTSIIKYYDIDTDIPSSPPSSSYIPIEIWDMKELQHIEILGKSFPPPPNDANCLKKVSTIIGVNVASMCNISELIQRFPNMSKLGARMELPPNEMVDHDLILSLFDHISTFEDFDTLKFSIINPVLDQVTTSSCSSIPRQLMLPYRILKLHLCGMGLPWEYMDAIGESPYLEVLKLRSYAFRGPKWETQDVSFPSLRYLLIEDSDLVQWEPGFGGFDNLIYLSFKHCFKLQELRWPTEESFGKIEFVDCNPLAVICANRLQSEEDACFTVTASDSF